MNIRFHPPAKADTIIMADHRVYFSTDNWQTACLVRPGAGKVEQLHGEDLELARFLAVSKSSWAGNAK